MFDRLQNWIPDFAAACAVADSSGFWAGAAETLLAIVGLATRQPGKAEMLDAIVH
jgi:TorA maturation chaperone TorD